MPPETKPTISSLAEMTCENCVFSATFQTGMSCNLYTGTGYQINPSYFCSEGQWLWLGVWDLIMDDKPKTHLFHYDELYEMFAREEHLTRKMRS